LLDSVLSSNEKHLQRAVDMILETGKRSVAVLGLSFKPSTDDLRESPLVELVKRLLGEGREVRIWDENVSPGRLVGSNLRYIEEVIPHIGSLLSADLEKVLRTSEVIVIGTRGIGIERLRGGLRHDHVVVDLVNLEKARRVDPHSPGLCW
jgi:GDP-mannose 6-dehydrogenase